MDSTVNLNQSLSRNMRYHIQSNLHCETMENLAVDAAQQAGVSAAIVNFISPDQQPATRERPSGNLFVLAFTPGISFFSGLDDQSLVHLTCPLLAAESGIRFFATAPLYADQQLITGMLCLLDFELKPFTALDQLKLEHAASRISLEIALLRSRRSKGKFMDYI